MRYSMVFIAISLIYRQKKCTSVIDIKFSERHFHCLQLDLIRSDARRQSTFYLTTNNYSRRSAYYAAITNAFFSTVCRFPLLNVVRRVPNKKIRDDCEKLSTKLKHLLLSHFLTNYVT